MQPYSISSISVNDHRIHVAEYGHPDAQPLLLIHGASGNTMPMQKMTALENQNLHIIEMHQRGVGLSASFGATEDNTIQDNIDDIERVREQLSVSQWSILSWSYGAVLMAGYAFAHPDACKALVTYAPFLGSQEDYDVLSQKKPDDAKLYFAAQGTTSATIIAQNFYTNARSADIETRKESYFNAQRVWHPDVEKEDFFATKSAEEWQTILQGRAVSAGHYRELYHEKDRFLEKIAHKQGALLTPVTLVYGQEDGWSEFNDYAATLFGNRKIRRAPKAGHGIDHPNAQEILKQELALI